MPNWGGHIGIDFQDIYYYLKPTDKQGRTWDEVPQEIKDTFDKLGIPEAEKKFLSGVKAQFESEVVYGSLKEAQQHFTKKAPKGEFVIVIQGNNDETN
jgi:Fe-S cluster assembly protein SufB